jgi:hypothetical protein
VQAEVADLNKRLAAAHESLAQSQLDLGETQQLLQDMRDKAAELESRCACLAGNGCRSAANQSPSCCAVHGRWLHRRSLIGCKLLWGAPAGAAAISLQILKAAQQQLSFGCKCMGLDAINNTC